MDETSSKASQEGPSSSKRRETPIWFTSLKPSHTEAFSCNSDLVKEARLCFFSTHPCNWVIDGTNNLSNIFRELAEGTGLLGEAIHEIQLSWTGPEELKQANYALQSMPKGLRYLPWNLQRSWVSRASMIPMLFSALQGTPIVPGVGRRGKMREQW